jgi:ATP-dependent RNA helicase DeaD
LYLDEADEMLNMGFYEDICKHPFYNSRRKKHLVILGNHACRSSANCKTIHARLQLEITVGTKNSGSATVSHEFYLVNARDRYEALKRLADANPDIFSVVFCRTKRDTQASC